MQRWQVPIASVSLSVWLYSSLNCLSLRPWQQEALLHILSGHDMYINLPTGFGKSLIFELTLLCFDHQRNNTLGKPEGAHHTTSNFPYGVADQLSDRMGTKSCMTI